MRDEPVMLSREQWAEVSEELNTLRARVAELEQIIRTDPDYAPWKKLELAEFREMVAIRDRKAAESRLARLREENHYLKEIYVDMGLHDSACRIDTDGECDCWHERFAAELQSLLTDTTVNSGGVVDGGENGISQKYHELLYHVSRKHPGETRHETALRYIKQAEAPQNHPPQQAKSNA